MSKFLHRFYDLSSGGAEVVILSFIKAFHQDQHLLVFNNYFDTWVSKELQRLPNVTGIKVTEHELPSVVTQHNPDLLFFHWYPPMTQEEFTGLSLEVLSRTILYNHWFTELPYIPGLKKFWFVSPTSQTESGRNVPPEESAMVLNPVREEFFQVRLQEESLLSVGRHSRPTPNKFSPDFFHLHEGIDVPDLHVRVLGCVPALAEAVERISPELRHTYWLLPFNSMPVTRFLSFVSVYLYKTHDAFHESCPVSILEALAAGIPVVAENKGGVSDLVLPGETGMLCNQLQDYWRAAKWLLEHPDQRRRLGNQARNWALANVSLSAYRKNCDRLLS